MTHPAEMMQSIRAALKPTGTWLLVDIKAHDTFALNMQIVSLNALEVDLIRNEISVLIAQKNHPKQRMVFSNCIVMML